MTKPLAALVVWLTATSTLLASLPHYECVCPSGYRKLICLGPLLGSSAGCCAVPKPTATKAACCCCEESPTSNADSGCHMEYVAPSLNGSVPLDGVIVLESPIDSALVGLVPSLSDTLPTTLLAECSSLVVSPPPPVDLVITLQHFVV